jgi:hypothetical protein
VIEPHTLARQQHLQSPPAEAAPHRSQLPQARTHRAVVRTTAPVANRGPFDPGRAARPPLAHPMCAAQVRHGFPPGSGALPPERRAGHAGVARRRCSRTAGRTAGTDISVVRNYSGDARLHRADTVKLCGRGLLARARRGSAGRAAVWRRMVVGERRRRASAQF